MATEPPKKSGDDADLDKLRNARFNIGQSKKKVDAKVKDFEREAQRVRKA